MAFSADSPLIFQCSTPMREKARIRLALRLALIEARSLGPALFRNLIRTSPGTCSGRAWADEGRGAARSSARKAMQTTRLERSIGGPPRYCKFRDRVAMPVCGKRHEPVRLVQGMDWLAVGDLLWSFSLNDR